MKDKTYCMECHTRFFRKIHCTPIILSTVLDKMQQLLKPIPFSQLHTLEKVSLRKIQEHMEKKNKRKAIAQLYRNASY